MKQIGRIAELWRYPVKSMGGERCPCLHLTLAGIAGDRRLAFQSSDAPTGKPLLRAAQRAAMLRFRASTAPGNRILIHTPTNGQIAADDPKAASLLALALAQVDPALSPVQITSSVSWLTPLHSAHPLTDVRPLSLHSVQTIYQLAAELDSNRLSFLHTGFDQRRFRANVVLDFETAALSQLIGSPGSRSDEPKTFFENSLVGRVLQLGRVARVRIAEAIPRCRLASLAPETATHDPDLLRHLARLHHGRAGVYARPLVAGVLREQDPVFLL